MLLNKSQCPGRPAPATKDDPAPNASRAEVETPLCGTPL